MKAATLRRVKDDLYDGQPIVALLPREVKVDSLICRAEQEAVYIAAETQPACSQTRVVTVVLILMVSM